MRIEGLEVAVVWVVVATGNVCFQGEPWFERCFFKGVPNIRGGGPGANVSAAESTELIDEFEVIVPAQFATPYTGSDGVTLLVGCALVEVCISPIEAEIIKINVAAGEPGDGRHGVQSPKFLIRIRVVIEYAGFGPVGFGDEGVHAPPGNLQDGLHTVKVEVYVRTFT